MRLTLATLGLLVACGRLTESPDGTGDEGVAGVPSGGPVGGSLSTGGTSSAGGSLNAGGTLVRGGTVSSGGVPFGGARASGGAELGGAELGGAELGGAPVVSGGNANSGAPSTGGSSGRSGGASNGGASSQGGVSISGGRTPIEGGASAGAGDAGGAGPTEPTAVSLVSTQSWDVVVTTTLTQRIENVPLPKCFRLPFTMLTEPTGVGEITAISSKDMHALVTHWIPDSGGYAPGQQPFWFLIPNARACGGDETSLDTVSIRALDENGDGIADRLVGTGTGVTKIWDPRAGRSVSHAISAEISGVPDRTPPSFVQLEPLSPLDPAVQFCQATELLVAGADVRLSTHPETPLMGSTSLEHSYHVYFTSYFEILPFSGTWTLSSTATDLAGLPIAPDWTLRTIDDPGIFPEDGFESAVVRMAVNGSAQRVSDPFGVPAISGQASLLIEPDSSVIFHLAHPPGTTTVHFRIRSFRENSELDGQSILARAGAIGAHRFQERGSQPSAGEPTGNSTWPYVGRIDDITIPVVEPGEIVLQIYNTCGPRCLLAALIDDLRME